MKSKEKERNPGSLSLGLKVPSGQIGSTWEWYHCIGLEKNINRYWFFNFTLEYLKRLQSSEPLHAKMNPTSCCLFDHSLHRILSTYWLANPPKCCSILVWIAGCWNSLLMSRNPKNNWCLSLHFWSTVRQFEHMQTVIQTSRRLDWWIHLCMKRLRTLNSHKIFKIKNEKQKTYSSWCPFQGLSNGTTLVQIQSGRTVPLRFVWIIKV